MKFQFNFNRSTISTLIGLIVFFVIIAMVGNVHVAEFFGAIAIAVIVGLIFYFKFPNFFIKDSNEEDNKEDNK